MLDLVIESSKTNQFVISTHSNIVATYLTGLPNSHLYRVSRKANSWPPEAAIEEVGTSPAERTAVLRELGYSFSDFDLWEGWLILEESSAERIIRDYLIPWFAPALKRIRLVSAGGVSEVGPTTNEFNRLVRFTHLESAYKNRVWVRMDGDEPGKKVMGELVRSYPSWNDDQIKCFDQPQFEYYYPDEFKEEVGYVLAQTDKNVQRQLKRDLLHKVIDWLEVDQTRAQSALEKSASSIIADLQHMANSLENRTHAK